MSLVLDAWLKVSCYFDGEATPLADAYDIRCRGYK